MVGQGFALTTFGIASIQYHNIWRCQGGYGSEIVLHRRSEWRAWADGGSVEAGREEVVRKTRFFAALRMTMKAQEALSHDATTNGGPGVSMPRN
jgi:hypothetical protein